MELKQRILNSLPRGYTNRISRPALLSKLPDISDRVMRAEIEELRRNDPDGAWICSSTDGGYWLAESLSELDSFLNQDAHRGHVILERVNAQRIHARYSAWAQGSLF